MPKIVEKKSGLIPQIDEANSHHYSKLTLKDLEEALLELFGKKYGKKREVKM